MADYLRVIVYLIHVTTLVELKILVVCFLIDRRWRDLYRGTQQGKKKTIWVYILSLTWSYRPYMKYY